MSILLALSAMAAQAAEPAKQSYRAQASESAWSVTIADGRMTYEAPGKRPVSVATPSPKSYNGMISYETPRLRLTIFPIACTDRSSGRRFADSVMVELGREHMDGCGGAELPADSLNGTSWHFAEVDGESTELTGDDFRDDHYAIDFHADGFLGYGGCNRIAAGYAQEDGVLTVKLPWGSTTGRCREPIMRRELRLIEILSAPVRISFPDADMLVLTGESGTIKLRRIKMEM